MTMTPDDIERARRQYDLLTGTPPDGYTHRAWSAVSDADSRSSEVVTEAFIEMSDLWGGGEFQHARATVIPGGPNAGLWLEVWRVRPHKEAAFAPPYVNMENRQ